MTRILRRPSRSFGILLLAVILVGCRRADERAIVLDLGRALGAAEATVETRAIVFGDPLGRPHLIAGFSTDEERSGGEPFVWGLGRESRLVFTVLRPRELVAELRAGPVAADERQEVDIRLNGEPMASLELEPGPADYRVTLPRALLQEGQNVLSFSYKIRRAPGGGERRPLAVAWYRIDFHSPAAAPPPAAAVPRVDAGRLVLPADSQVDYFLQLPPRCELRLRGWSVGGVVEITLESDEEEPRQVAALRGHRGAAAFPLGAGATRLARLRLRARGGDGDDGASPAILEAPQVVARSPIPPPPRPSTPEEAAIPPTVGRGANVLVYLVDTLRADRLGAYGSSRGLTPRLDSFAAAGVLFERAYAQSSWTRASVASLLTGLWPASHGTNGRRDGLAAGATTLAEVLRDAGYATAAVVTNPNLDARFGLDQGFESYLRIDGTAPPRSVREAALRWLDDEPRGRPFFLYVHTVEPHDPYTPPPDLRRRFAGAVPRQMMGTPGRKQRATPELVAAYSSLYDAEVAWSDRAFGRILDALKKRGLEKSTLIVFLSDHGEELQEHGGWKHGVTLYGEVLDIPLLVGGPGLGAGLRISEPVQQLDVLPTILDYLAVQAPPGIEGRSLLPLLRGAAGGGVTPVVSYLDLDGTPRVSVIVGRWKLIQQRVGGQVVNLRLFDLDEDPGESRNLAAERPVLAGYLGSLISARLERGPLLGADLVEPDGELEKSLRALGYL